MAVPIRNTRKYNYNALGNILRTIFFFFLINNKFY